MLCSAKSVTVSGHITIPEQVAKDEALNLLPPFKVVLDGGVRSTLSTSNGYFSFQGVEAGRYTLDVFSEKFMFSQVRQQTPHTRKTMINTECKLFLLWIKL